jgi:hypothetical protein
LRFGMMLWLTNSVQRSGTSTKVIYAAGEEGYRQGLRQAKEEPIG